MNKVFHFKYKEKEKGKIETKDQYTDIKRKARIRKAGKCYRECVRESKFGAIPCRAHIRNTREGC